MAKSTLTPAERKALYRLFADYRAAKVAIATRSMPAKSGYASAIHPDLIHSPNVHPLWPKDVCGFSATPVFNDKVFRRYVARIDRQVKRLPPYQRSIIRKRFLCRGPLPTDSQVHAELRQEGWYVSKRYFDDEKSIGLSSLFQYLKSDQISDVFSKSKTE